MRHVQEQKIGSGEARPPPDTPESFLRPFLRKSLWDVVAGLVLPWLYKKMEYNILQYNAIRYCHAA